jgi:hypothetical protein
MKHWLAVSFLTLVIGAGLSATPAFCTVDATVDGSPANIDLVNLPANIVSGNSMPTVDVVGGTSNSSTRTGLAKGNCYRVDTDVVLNMAEFWLTFSNTQTLTYYVFESPVEFGTYTEVHRHSGQVTGSGSGWYSSGPLSINLVAGMHYCIAVSFNGTLTYYYNTGDSQATSFGAHVHAYATGTDPLPTSISSTVNDQAIYHQRITTDAATPVEPSTWSKIKRLYD